MNIEKEYITYAAYSKNEEIRYSSSSGGIFTHLAENVLSNNGVVFGAMFEENFNVVLNYINTVDELQKLRGSKYVKSKTGNSLKKAKEFLDMGKIVYFSGTPCQIAGLKAFLKRDYDNLITQDVICHGSPDPKVWRKYIDYIQSACGVSAEYVFFRHKSTGWKDYSITIDFMDGDRLSQKASENRYMKGFLKNIYLCESCYKCRFKGDNYFSDITLGDFWGIENVLPGFSDDKGVSLVLIRSAKAKKIFDEISPELIISDAEYEKAAAYNSALLLSAEKDKRREKFYYKFNDGNIADAEFEKLLIRYCDSFIIKLKSRIRKILKGRLICLYSKTKP